jgi:hypothetical protein
VKQLVTILIGILGLLLLLSFLQPLASDKIANSGFHALFSNNEHDNPKTVEILVNGRRTVFYKHTESYKKLLLILQNGHSQNAFDRAGPIPSIESQFKYGEIVIYQFGFPSHLKLYRSNKNENYFWIGVPHADGRGTHFPLFTFGSDFLNLVEPRNTAEQGAAANP